VLKSKYLLYLNETSLFINKKDLAHCARVSRFLYVFSRDDQLWKKHCLDKWGSDHEVMQNFMFRGTWLLTYLFPTMLSKIEEEKVWTHPLCRLLQFPGKHQYS